MLRRDDDRTTRTCVLGLIHTTSSSWIADDLRVVSTVYKTLHWHNIRSKARPDPGVGTTGGRPLRGMGRALPHRTSSARKEVRKYRHSHRHNPEGE